MKDRVAASAPSLALPKKKTEVPVVDNNDENPVLNEQPSSCFPRAEKYAQKENKTQNDQDEGQEGRNHLALDTENQGEGASSVTNRDADEPTNVDAAYAAMISAFEAAGTTIDEIESGPSTIDGKGDFEDNVSSVGPRTGTPSKETGSLLSDDGANSTPTAGGAAAVAAAAAVTTPKTPVREPIHRVTEKSPIGVMAPEKLLDRILALSRPLSDRPRRMEKVLQLFRDSEDAHTASTSTDGAHSQIQSIKRTDDFLPWDPRERGRAGRRRGRQRAGKGGAIGRRQDGENDAKHRLPRGVFKALPNDVLYMVLGYLSAKDLGIASRVSTDLYQIANEVAVSFFRDIFGGPHPPRTSRCVLYQLVERARTPRERNVRGLLLYCARHGYTRLARQIVSTDPRWQWTPDMAERDAKRIDGPSPLYVACEYNRLKILQILAEAGAPFEPPGLGGTGPNGWLPIHVAAAKGHPEIVRYLVRDLQAAVDMHACSSNGGGSAGGSGDGGVTAAQLAADGGNIEVLRILIFSGSDINAASAIRDNSGGEAALHAACARGRARVVRSLLSLGADPTQETADGRTPIIIAADCGHEKVVSLLLRWRGSLSNEGVGGNGGGQKWEGSGRFPSETKSDTAGTGDGEEKPAAGVVASHSGPQSITGRRARVSKERESEGNDRRHGAGKDRKLRKAIEEGKDRRARKASGEGKDRKLRKGMEEEKEPEEEKEIFPPGDPPFDINAATTAGKTALYAACERGHVGIVKLLVDAGAIVNKATCRRKIPLYAAAEQGNAAIVSLLLPHSTKNDLFFETTYGTTPLFIANKQGNPRVKQQLLNFTTRFMRKEKRSRWKDGFKPPTFGTTGAPPPASPQQ